ncbi:MAG: hypothetical protein ACXV5Q_04810 [Frankiaceae bacterium]
MPDPVLCEAIEALRALPGVAGAHIQPDDRGGPGLLRLDLVRGVDEVAVATEVGRLLRDRFGIGIDAGRVQLVEDADTRDRRGDAGIPRLARMHLLSAGRHVTATVQLTWLERVADGAARRLATQSGMLEAVAAATMQALEDLAEDAVLGRVLSVVATQNEAGQRVRVRYLLEVGDDEIEVSAEAPVRADVRQAVIRAAVRAVAPYLPRVGG